MPIEMSINEKYQASRVEYLRMRSPYFYISTPSSPGGGGSVLFIYDVQPYDATFS
jgi:hypothetical protein